MLAGLLGCTLHAQNTSENNNHIKSVKTASPEKSHIETPEEREERDRKQGSGLKAGWSTSGPAPGMNSVSMSVAYDLTYSMDVYQLYSVHGLC